MIESIRIIVEEIRLRNFRAFENTRLELSDLTFLVGRNGAGKSSLLDAMDLLREAVSDSLENALDRRGGLQNVQSMNVGLGNKPRMGIAVVFRVIFPSNRQTKAIYGFEVENNPDTGSLFIRECFKSSVETSFDRKDNMIDSTRTLSVSPPTGNLILPLIARSDSLWELALNAIRNLRAYELSPTEIAGTVEIGERSTLNRYGSNAGDVLKAIEGTDAYHWVVKRLGMITEGISKVHAEALLGRRVLCFYQKQEDRELKFDASQVSQGTLRGLGILLALKQKPTPSVVLIDEIENSLHPSALSVLLDAALASSKDIRVVLTTHSPEVLSHSSVTGERVRVIEWSKGISNIYRLSLETQQSVNEIDTVGWMLRSNALWIGPHPETFEGDLFSMQDGTKNENA